MGQRLIHLGITPGTTLIISTGDDEGPGDQFLMIEFTNHELKVTGLIPGNKVPGMGVLHHEKFNAPSKKLKGKPI